MKKIFTVSILLTLVCTSFIKMEDEETHYKNNGYFFAILDGKMFELRDEDKYRAELINRTGMINQNSSSSSRVDNSLTFFGPDFTDSLGKVFTESIEFSYNFDDGSIGEPKDLKIEVKFDRNSYYQMDKLAKFRVTKIDWNEDRRSFFLSADFDCKMRQWGFPAESQPIIRVKGRMVNIHVTVPPWIQVKNPKQTADN
jgi:hypothetical protein